MGKKHARRSRMNRELQKAIKEDAFSLVERLIYQKAWEFTYNYGGSFEDWRQEAMLIFVKSLDTLDESKSNITTWTVNKIHWGLMEIVRKRSRCSAKVTFMLLGDMIMEEEETDILPFKKKPHMLSLVDHLEDSSRELFWLLVNPPQELDGIIDVKDPIGTMDAIIWYCKHKLKWTQKQINVSMQELQEICQG
jgi:hypothetical protein